jgi:dihydroxyacetone kinase-like protein
MPREELSTKDIRAWLRAAAVRVNGRRDDLNALDAAIGDGDHGANLDRGLAAVVGALDGLAEADIGTTLKRAGMTLVSTVGGASGPLYGTLFLQAGGACAGMATLPLGEWTDALQAGVMGVAARGRASLNDKTMVDALMPAVDALADARDRGMDLRAALDRSAAAAEAGAVATIPLVARKGRASYLGDRSAGHQDPGATSSALILRELARILPK